MLPRGILFAELFFNSMQLASFFSGSRVEQEFGSIRNVTGYSAQFARESLIRASGRFDCTRCEWKSCNDSYGVARPPMDVDLHPLGNVVHAVGTADGKASLLSLNDDVLLVVISYLDTSSLLVFGKAYDRVAKLASDMNVRHFYCFLVSSAYRLHS